MRRLIVALLLSCPSILAAAPGSDRARSPIDREIAPLANASRGAIELQDDASSRSPSDAIRARIIAARRLGDSAIAELHRLIQRAEAEDDGSTKNPLRAMKAKLNELVQRGRKVEISLPNGNGEKLAKVKVAVSKWADEVKEYLSKVKSDFE
jgi:hypothetical protein